MNEVYYGVEPYSGKIICHYGIPDMAWGFSKGVANGLRKAVGIFNPQTGEYIYNKARQIGRGIADFYDNVSGNKRRREQARLNSIKEKSKKAGEARDKQVEDLKNLNYYRNFSNKYKKPYYIDIAEKYDPKYQAGKALDKQIKQKQDLQRRRMISDIKRAERSELQKKKEPQQQDLQSRRMITDFKRAERSELQKQRNLKRRREQGQ